MRLLVKVVPGARRDEVGEVLDLPTGPRLKVKVAAPPEDGRANDAVRSLIACRLNVAPRAVTLVAGHTSREKALHVEGLTAQAVAAALWAAPPGPASAS